jgi:uncharacterized membrane protein YgdD (TMEM256/DUF423 family)
MSVIDAHVPRTGIAVRLLGASGALLLAAAVALAAYAAHGVDGEAQARLNSAAGFAFGHGLALAALAPQARSPLALLVLATLLLGTLLFCGGVVALTLFGVSLGVAPFGGTLLIAGWLGWALVALRG